MRLSAPRLSVLAGVVSLGAVGALAAIPARAERNPDGPARDIVTRFERALQDHDVPAISTLVADDIVVFENGHRNEGWPDFRDNHLVPEMKEPKYPMKSRLVKFRAAPQMAWAYTRTELYADARKAGSVSHLLWSVYVLERRPDGWKIVALDWSMARQK